MENKKNMEIVEDALECQPLYYQFTELDTEDELHDGTSEGIRNHYTDEGILNEAYWRADTCNANREPDGTWSEDYRDYESDYIQLQRFIKKWINKIEYTGNCAWEDYMLSEPKARNYSTKRWITPYDPKGLKKRLLNIINDII